MAEGVLDDGSRAPGSLIRMVMESNDASAASTSSIFTNFPLISSIIAFALAQSIKVLTTWYRERRWDLKQLVASGGMPSSHSATVTALATAVGFQEGIGSSLFATTAILAAISQVERRRENLQVIRLRNFYLDPLSWAIILQAAYIVIETSGGMPSSHSATVTALATAVGFQEGIGSSLFATTAILAAIVMHDAFGVRLHAGRQAEVLNQIVYELPAEHPLSESRPLREILGHTPLQVIAGALLGIITSCVVRLIVLIVAS